MAFVLVGVFVAGSASTALASSFYNYLTTDSDTPTAPNLEESVIVSTSPAKPKRVIGIAETPDLFDAELRAALDKRRAKIMPGN